MRLCCIRTEWLKGCSNTMPQDGRLHWRSFRCWSCNAAALGAVWRRLVELVSGQETVQ